MKKEEILNSLSQKFDVTEDGEDWEVRDRLTRNVFYLSFVGELPVIDYDLSYDWAHSPRAVLTLALLIPEALGIDCSDCGLLREGEALAELGEQEVRSRMRPQDQLGHQVMAHSLGQISDIAADIAATAAPSGGLASRVCSEMIRVAACLGLEI